MLHVLYMEQAKAYSCVSGERSDSLNFTAPLSIISVILFFFNYYYLFYFRLRWPVKHPACTGGDSWPSGSSEWRHSQHPAPVLQKKKRKAKNKTTR